MKPNTFNFNEKIYSNNIDILNSILSDLQEILNISHENLVIKRICDVIKRMNFFINENKKNTELTINHIKNLENKIDPKFGKLNINDNQELKLSDRRYIGQVVNGSPEGRGEMYFDNGDIYKGEFKNGKCDGKGVAYYNNGDRYEGDFKNNKKDGKGVSYYNNADRYEGDYKNDKREGKGVYYYNNGNIYEGDYKNGKCNGKGIYYFNDGDRRMGNWYDEKEIGKHIMLTKGGEVKEINY